MKTIVVSTCFSLLTLSLYAANWPSFRGPNHDGSSPAKQLPKQFSKDKGVKWQVAMPGPAASVPVIWGDKVFVSSSQPDTQKLLAICFDVQTGKELWRNEVTDGYRYDDRSNLASPSPATDGELVYFLYGSSILVAFDFDGKQVWKRDLGKDYGNFATQWTYSSSPVLDNGRLYIQVLQRNQAFEFYGMQKGDPNGKNESYLLALEPKTGKEIWRHVRPSDAVGESLEAFSTPVFTDHAKGRQVLISGGDSMSGHLADTGEELWRLNSWNPAKIGHWRLVPSPVVGEGIALICAPKKEPAYAVSLDAKGSVDPLWSSNPREVSSDVSTPLFYQGHFYVIDSDRKTLSCVEPKTGKLVWRGEYPTRIKIESSPTGADGHIYAVDQLGKVFVVKAGGSEMELVNTADFGAPGVTSTNSDNIVRASISVTDGKIFVRAQDQLYCIGE